MKYEQSDFSRDLNKLIDSNEHSFSEHCELLLSKYIPIFTKRKQKINIELIRLGRDPYKQGYVSFVLIEITLELSRISLQIPIWKCQRYFLGIPFSKNIPGSKLVGELITTFEDAQYVFTEFIEDNLN